MKVFELKRQISEKRAKVKAIVEKAESENREMSDAEKADYDAIKADVESLKNRVAVLENVEDDDSDSPVEESARNRQGKPITFEDRTAPAIHSKKHEYSLNRAIALKMENRQLDGLEGETHQELERKSGKKARGFYMPNNMLKAKGEERALTTSNGVGALQTNYSDDFVDYLRTRLVVSKLGARFLTGMQGTFALPRQTGTATAQWVTEGNAATGSQQTLDQILFTPKSCTAWTDISRKLILQSSFDAEAFVREDLSSVVARAIDAAALVGAGTGATPLGVTKDPAVPVHSLGANGGAPTFADFVALEALVYQNNIGDLVSPAYTGNAQALAYTKTTPMIGSTYPMFINTDNKINGYDFYASQQIPNNLTSGSGTNLSPIVFGDWSQLMIAVWGDGLDVLVDPYTGSTSGTVRIVVFEDVDIHPRQPQAFAIMNSANFPAL